MDNLVAVDPVRLRHRSSQHSSGKSQRTQCLSCGACRSCVVAKRAGADELDVNGDVGRRRRGVSAALVVVGTVPTAATATSDFAVACAVSERPILSRRDPTLARRARCELDYRRRARVCGCACINHSEHPDGAYYFDESRGWRISDRRYVVLAARRCRLKPYPD